MVAITGTYLSIRLISGSVEERFTRQLIEAWNATSDGLAQQERLHLQAWRAFAFTEGIDAAVAAATGRGFELCCFRSSPTMVLTAST